MKKPARGDPLNIPARTFTTMIDAAEDFQRRQLQQDSRYASRRPEGLVLVQNISGSDQARFAVLGISGVVFTPTDNADEFKQRIALTATTPATGSHEGKFVVLWEPIRDDELGWAWIWGVCPVQINVTNSGHSYADITNADATKLTSNAAGGSGVLIVWKESGTGTKWAVVAFGAKEAYATVRYAKVTGSPGSSDTVTATLWNGAAFSGASITLDTGNGVNWEDVFPPVVQNTSTFLVVNITGVANWIAIPGPVPVPACEE